MFKIVAQSSDGRWAINIKNGGAGNTVLNNVLFINNSGHRPINTVAESLSGLTSDQNIVVNRFSPDNGNSVLTLFQWQTRTGQDMNSIVASRVGHLDP